MCVIHVYLCGACEGRVRCIENMHHLHTHHTRAPSRNTHTHTHTHTLPLVSQGSEPRLTSLHAGSTSSYVWFSTSGLGVAGVLVEPEVTSSLGYWRRACSPHFPSSHIPVMAQFYIKPS